MAPAIPIISSAFSQPPDQTHGALTTSEHESLAPFHEQVNASWESSVTLPLDEPLTSKLREEIKLELRRYWHEIREEKFCTSLKWAWTSDTDYMLSVDSLLKSENTIKSRQLERFYNKPTTLYWAHSAQKSDRCPRFIWGCIYKEWVRYHDYKPKMDFEHFFANPIRIISTGPTTISDIVETHEYLYNQTSLLLDKIGREEFEKARMSAQSSPQNFRLFPICRAIIMIFDQLASGKAEHFSGMHLLLDKALQRQNVLMVRTGDESGISEPISFESVRVLWLDLT